MSGEELLRVLQSCGTMRLEDGVQMGEAQR